jgi:hypothetical protein
MKTYGVGSYRIGVYETRDAWPRGAVAVVADMDGLMVEDAMIEAVARNCRLKIAKHGDFELRCDHVFCGRSAQPTNDQPITTGGMSKFRRYRDACWPARLLTMQCFQPDLSMIRDGWKH